ncbi:hypothetical protein [Burkholderia sp. BCC1998]|uniref:hypothetical protein n=1 Tax=Burkholderia sp. BCC1998 TaxID=2817447 RepID=UPI002AB60E5E|nr:hypothetical protein [Burkholderia sp. BCC1998]
MAHPDPLEQIMKTVVEGFKQTTDQLRELHEKQARLEQTQKEQAKAAYNGMTGSGKSRYVATLVEIERSVDDKGAQARVANMLDLSAGRISQLLNSEKNRNNGK